MNDRHNTKRGLTLVEAIMAMLIVSVLLVAAMRATAASGLVQYKTAERVKGRFLADGLMNDMVGLSYEDPNVTPLFGRESGETASSKANYNDLDDFNGWSESPPQDSGGTVMPNLTGWRRTVTVERVNPGNLSQVLGSETGAKRITVSVFRNNLLIATRVTIRTSAQ